MKINAICLIAATLLLTQTGSASAVSVQRGVVNGGVTLRASVPAGSVVNTGDRMAFEYQSRANASMIIFSIDSRGYVHLLHPLYEPETAQANTRYTIPSAGSDFVVDTPTGVEFVFALAVPDLESIDRRELDYLRGLDAPGADPYRISGDPFIAANMIAAELVRGISHSGAVFGYTHFYVNERVDYPCYLCGACDGVADDLTCANYSVVQNFDRASPLPYPLRRGYDMVEGGVASSTVEGTDGDVVVNFYPYGSEVRYIDPVTYDPGYAWWGLYDPFYWYWPGYYPYCGTGWGISIGWGWGWGYGWGWGWGCGWYGSGWYAPGYGDGWYPGGGGSYPEKFKSSYKSGDLKTAGTLTKNRAYAAQRDGSLRIAQKDVQRSVTRANKSAYTSRGTTLGRTGFAGGRAGTPGVKTNVYGGRSGAIKGAPYRGTTQPRYSGKAATRSGSGTIKRSPTSRGGSSQGVKSRGTSSRGSSSGVKSRGSSSRGSSSGVKSRSSSRGSSRSSGAAKSRGSSGGRSSGKSRR
jgi:hypothetical protein